MTGIRPVLVVAMWLMLLLPRTAEPHATATGLAAVAVADGEIAYRLTIVPAELPEPAARLITEAMAGSRPAAERLADAVRQAVSARIGNAACRPGRVAVQDLGAGLKTLIAYDLHCSAAPGRLVLREDWTGLFGAHYQTIAAVRTPQGGGEYRLGPDQPELTVDVGPASRDGVGAFVRMGVLHILTGYDHLLFLLALIAGAGGFWSVVAIASMFTLAHSVTLSLAVLGLVDAPASVVEPLIALSIVWVAGENLVGGGTTGRRCALTFGFGLVHGLGFADALAPLALRGWGLVRALGGFNLGVELEQFSRQFGNE
jgi:HupE / UreJ protein